MKPVWNSLLLTFNVLAIALSGTSIVLAEPTAKGATDLVVPTSLVQQPQTPNLVVPATVLQPTSSRDTDTTQQPKTSRSSQQVNQPKPEDDETAQKLKLRLEESKRQQKLIEADRLYLGGQFAAAEKIYREVKAPFAQTTVPQKRLNHSLTPPSYHQQVRYTGVRQRLVSDKRSKLEL
jgi:hypothetical protein